MSRPIKDRHYYDDLDQQRHARKVAEQESAKQSEVAHRAKSSRDFDDDEMLAACGLPPRPRRHQ